MGLSERQIPQSADGQGLTGNIVRSIRNATLAVKREDVVADEALLPKLRVLFVTEDDPLYVIRFFDILFAEYPREELEICGITIERAFHEPIWKTLGRMHGFYGPWGTFRQGLRFIDARLRGRSIASLARSAGIPLVGARSVNQPEYIAQVRAMAPDVIVSVAAPEIFKPELLEVPRLGCINIHSGRLPHVSRHDADLLADAARGESGNDHSAPHGREARCGRRAGDTGFRNQDIRFS